MLSKSCSRVRFRFKLMGFNGARISADMNGMRGAGTQWAAHRQSSAQITVSHKARMKKYCTVPQSLGSVTVLCT